MSADIYSLLVDFPGFGPTWVELTAEESTSLSIADLIVHDEFDRPLAVHGRNIFEGWSKDVSREIASLVTQLAYNDGVTLSSGASNFVSRAP